jgi:hypothetical protein
MLMDMDCQQYPASSLAPFQAMLTHTINELPSLSPDERVGRLRQFLGILEKFREKLSQKYCDAGAGAVAETAAAPTAAADSDSARSAADCGASHSHKAAVTVESTLQSSLSSAVQSTNLRPDTVRRCDEVRDFALAYIKEHPDAPISATIVAHQYQAKTGVDRKTTELLFRNNYLDLRNIIAAARDDRVSLCPPGAARVAFNSIQAFLEAKNKQNPRTAAKVKAAADWCVQKMQELPAGLKKDDKKNLLLKKWSAEDSDRPQNSGSLGNYFKNGPFSMTKLMAYGRGSAPSDSGSEGCGAGEDDGCEAAQGVSRCGNSGFGNRSCCHHLPRIHPLPHSPSNLL